MDDYREAQRQKWMRDKQAKESASAVEANSSDVVGAGTGGYVSASTSAPPTDAAGSATSASASSTAAASSSQAAASSSSPPRELRRTHILPVQPCAGSDEARTYEAVLPELMRMMKTKEVLKTGQCLLVKDAWFCIVKNEPDEGILCGQTDIFTKGDSLPRFEKVQFVCLPDFNTSRGAPKDNQALFKDYISPFFSSKPDYGLGTLIEVGQQIQMSDREFKVMDAVPRAQAMHGIITKETLVYVDFDNTPEFVKIHIVPFQDTLPTTYSYDVFADYLKPYLLRNKYTTLSTNSQFSYQGVQFKVVCAEPDGPARVGPGTTIYCEGVLHPSLRNLLPPELLEQLSHFPPGLQQLLLNTEALAGGYEERIMEVQEMLSRRRGLSTEAIGQIERFSWGEQPVRGEQAQCMVCLSEFAGNDEVMRLPCGHVFHASCVEEWLRRCTDCPICKANVASGVRGRDI
eukprot:TRINITY_DN10852_c0_g1_i2.p1 TRINITY_DN10852_c0_g1~~TRINITY_DN10852_c0_g1_i2.p1  ORF type:complete len:459 (+),score=101.71 TRINITY_DN10852_c0_g1_i2:102-1478(+)